MTKGSYTASVTKVFGEQLVLNNGRIVGLIGVYIPFPKDANYIPDLQENVKNLLLGKEVKIQTVLKKHSTGYPKLDLVKITLDDIRVNEYLLKNGLAFFNEDYWDNVDKERFRNLETEAKQNRVGLWAKKEELKLLLVRHKNWWDAYAPECEFVKDIPPEDRIEYYTPLPEPPHLAITVNTVCAKPDPSVFLLEEQAKS